MRIDPITCNMTKEGPDLNTETKIIAVEFAIRFPELGGNEVELEMFSCNHTIKKSPTYGYHEVRFTMHTSNGDRTIRQQVNFS